MLSSFFFFIVVLTMSPAASRLRLFRRNKKKSWSSSNLFLSTDNNEVAPVVTGEELWDLLTEGDMPLVLDAYAEWCEPCMIMAPEFDGAAEELIGRVRFVKLDTDASPEMASRLKIMELPMLLFFNRSTTVLRRIEDAIRKDSIVELSEHLFFDEPMPEHLQ